MTWSVQEAVGAAAVFHARPLEPPVGREVAVFRVVRPALVLGSTQPRTVVDGTAVRLAGVDVVRRRSGGGAVLLRPDEVLWLDVTVPAGDPLWEPDVGRAFHWLGRAWVAALADEGVEAAVHLGALRRTPWSASVCFAGLGPGEVTVGGRKVVGISQRRTRHGARFQCLVLRRWDPMALIGLLAMDGDHRQRAVEELAEVAAGIDRPDALVPRLLAQLSAV